MRDEIRRKASEYLVEFESKRQEEIAKRRQNTRTQQESARQEPEPWKGFRLM